MEEGYWEVFRSLELALEEDVGPTSLFLFLSSALWL
jgi:hypothetical protein